MAPLQPPQPTDARHLRYSRQETRNYSFVKVDNAICNTAAFKILLSIKSTLKQNRPNEIRAIKAYTVSYNS